jgi:Ig-like domain from next to BRCA1 gene
MKIKRQLIIVVLAGALMASCTGQATQATEEPTVDVNAVMTAGIGTFVAALTQTQAARATLATQTPSPTWTVSPVALNSITPPSTSTQSLVLPLPTVVFVAPTVTGTQYTPTVNPSTLGSGCNNLALIRDETIPDGTVMKPGETFRKVWKVENNGTCDWVYLYRLVFLSGDRMEGDPPGLGKVIPPSKWTQLYVDLVAPSRPGTYTGNWKLGNQSGSVFGSTLTVSIVVETPSYP